MEKMRRRFQFTCESVTRQSRHGFFTKGQKLVIYDDDSRLAWFRSGGFKEIELAPEPIPEKSPGAASNAPGGDPLKMLIADMAGIAPITRAALAKAGLTTAGDLVAMSDDELLAIEGIAAKSLASIRTACEVLFGAEA